MSKRLIEKNQRQLICRSKNFEKFSKNNSLLNSAKLMEYTNNIYQKVELSKEVFSETSQMFGAPTDSQIRTLGQKQRKSNMNSDVKQYNL